MGSRSGTSIQKRLREAAKRQRKMDRQAKKDRRAEERAEDKELNPKPEPVGDEDPDIAGIVPGPQPLIYDIED
ncbi:MAG: hypothetical protein QGH45_20555 [Myxococcota bacterium]|jgi:hypothetical protein|nr:hypothetical protein [Myxococcota bacterium]